MNSLMHRFRALVRSYWGRNVAPCLNDLGLKGAEPLSPAETLWNKMIDAGGCVDCTKTPKSFFEGPSGGMSTNVFCGQCGQGYNLTPVAHWAERIHRDTSYVEEPRALR